MTKVFHVLQKKLGIIAGHSTFSMEAFKDECVDMENVHVFVNESSHSSWTEFFGEFGDPQEHEFGGIQSLFNITPKLILEHSEEIKCTNDSQLLSILDEISIVSWSSDPVDKGQVLVYSGSAICLGKIIDSKDVTIR